MSVKMRKNHGKSRRRARKQPHSKTRGRSQNHDEVTRVAESSIQNARIKSAIENGARITLPSGDSNGFQLSKFEHIGRGGPLVVYAEDKKLFNKFGHFNVITSFRPPDSLRNQLFFASHSSGTEVSGRTARKEVGKTSDKTREPTSSKNLKLTESKNNNQDKTNIKTNKQTHHQPHSFEELIVRYKDRQEKYKHLLGDDSLYLFQKIDNMCKVKSKEKVEIEIPKVTIMDHRKPHEIQKGAERKNPVVLPRINVQETGDKDVYMKVKPNSNRLHVSKKRQPHNLPSLGDSKLY